MIGESIRKTESNKETDIVWDTLRKKRSEWILANHPDPLKARLENEGLPPAEVKRIVNETNEKFIKMNGLYEDRFTQRGNWVELYKFFDEEKRRKEDEERRKKVKPSPKETDIKPQIVREIPYNGKFEPTRVVRINPDDPLRTEAKQEPGQEKSSENPQAENRTNEQAAAPKNETTNNETAEEFNLDDIETAQGRAFGNSENLESENFDPKDIKSPITPEAIEDNMSKEFETAQGRAMAGPEEAVKSDDIEPGNISEADLEKMKNYIEYKDSEEISPAKNDSADYLEIKDEEPTKEAIKEPEPVTEPEKVPEKPRETGLTPEESAELQEKSRAIMESIEASRKERLEQEKTPLEKKNELIKKHSDIIVGYMRVRERAIELQEKINEDKKLFSEIKNKFKNIVLGDPKTNVMSDYKRAYDSVKSGEKEIEEKTGVTQNELMQLWKQYKQSKEKQKMMAEHDEEIGLFKE